jgi:O-antigen/teichoic acid export membrane protein
MSTLESRQSTAQARRLQLLLLLMILWDLLALAGELSFGGPLVKLKDGEIDGILGARASFAGAAVVPIGLYFYALVRGAARHRFVLWCAALEQGAAALFGVYHIAANDIDLEPALVPLIVALVLLVLVLINMPGAPGRQSLASS